MNTEQEFDRQVDTLLQKNYPGAAGISTKDFLRHVEPLKVALKHITTPDVDLDKGHIPFVIVIKSALIPTEKAMSLVKREGKMGIVKLFPLETKDFQIIESETVPDQMVYLLADIDRGKETINLPPKEAMKRIKINNRSPLTIDEGIAIVTHFPEFLMKNNCFSLLASRHLGDKRVPAIWINANKHPNLGWCWDGNPHTWLGSASAKERIFLS